jgi:hypothetical protein
VEGKKMFKMQSVLVVAVLGVVACWLNPSVRADDKKADPVGTWKWSFMGQNGQTREMTLKVAKEGDKYTAALMRRNGETKADKVEFKDGELSFEVTRERNGEKMTTKYKGKVEGDMIKGTIESANGNSREWEAKRHTA